MFLLKGGCMFLLKGGCMFLLKGGCMFLLKGGCMFLCLYLLINIQICCRYILPAKFYCDTSVSPYDNAFNL